MKLLSKFREKLDMYDMIIANLIAGKSIIEPSEHLDNSQIAIGFSNISSETRLIKYFSVNKYPDYLQDKIMDEIRKRCITSGVKINFYIYVEPYKINWDSADMRNKMQIWNQFSEEHSGEINIFNYRTDRKEAIARRRIIESTKYLNESEFEYKRSTLKASFIIEISARRTEDSIYGMSRSIEKLKDICNNNGLGIRELRVNMIDWMRAISPFSLNANKETDSKLIKKVLIDDNLANFNSYKQGRVGLEGVPIGIDVLSNSVVLRKFKADPDGADNWIISAETGGGKSMWLKSLLTYLLAKDFTVCVMDYEGDEYTNLANFIRADNPDDVKIVSMGKGSAYYFDPCEIPELTGDIKVDADLKTSAISFITAIYRIITHGIEGDFTTQERKVLMTAIQRMYDSAGVTEDMNTWHRSKGLRLHDIYREIKEIVETKEFVDSDNDNVKHKAALYLLDSSSIYFEEGEANSDMFLNPMSANDLYKARFIVFSFGMKGVSDSAIDKTVLALKQLSVAYVNIQISNNCKYVKHGFNVKVWEEFQRWGESEGSAETIANAITGGRKRGDVNFIITNDLNSMLSDNNKLMRKLSDNIQNYAIGKIKNKKTREKFCETFDCWDCLGALNKIARASSLNKHLEKHDTDNQNKYKNSFCIITDDGTKSVVKSILPKSILESSLFSTGVQIE